MYTNILRNCTDLIEEIIRFSRLSYERKLVSGSGGNLSVRVPNNRDLFIATASGVSLRDVAAENLVVVDTEGSVVEGPAGFRPSKEIGFHLGIFTARPGVGAVIHVHPVFAVLQSSTRRRIPLVTISAQLKLKQGPVVDEAPPGSLELRENVMSAMSRASDEDNMLLMENHGIVSWGVNLASAFDTAELAADTAEIALRRESLSVFPGITPSEDIRIVDLTIPLNASLQCYPTDPHYSKEWHTSFEDSGIRVSRIMIGTHSGTHVDAPSHFLESGKDITGLGISAFLGSAIVIDTPKNPGEDIGITDLRDREIRGKDIVLFRTGWGERASSPSFFEDEWPGFEPELIEYLAARDVKALGGDIPSADSPGGIRSGAPAHKNALAHGLPIFEALVNLKPLIGRRFFFIGLPLKIEEGDGSPIRAIGIIRP